MRLYSINGKLIYKNVSKYRIKWDGSSLSKLQFRVKQFLKPYWQSYICFEEFPVYSSKLRLDLFNATLNIAIEVNGNQHINYNPFFHQNSPERYLRGVKNDVKKSEWLNLNNIKLIEIYEDEVPLLSKDFFKNKFNIEL